MRHGIAAIVPIHNELESTKRFLESYYLSLQESPLSTYVSLIVVDDGSTDGSYEYLSEAYPGIEVLRGDGGLWWSGSVNFALRQIMGRPLAAFLLFNNDNILHVDYFKNLAVAIDALGDNKIISAKVVNLYPEQYVIYGGVTFDRKRSRYVVNPAPNQPAVVNTAGGMGVLIPLEVVHRTGMFDQKNFPQKSGDTDFYLRAERVGYRVHYSPSLIVYNDNSVTGYSGNSSFREMIRSYSFPKGYMNLKVDLRLFLTHGTMYWSIYRVARCNAVFLTIGLYRSLRTAMKAIYKKIQHGEDIC